MTPDMKDCSWDGVCGDGGAPHEEGGGGDGRGSQGVQRRRHGLQEGGAESCQWGVRSTNPRERSELRYRVQGVGFGVGYPLSPRRGLHWEGFKACGKVKVDQENVLH